MELFRLTDPLDPRYARSMAAYARSFPAHEQRSDRAQAAALADPAYCFYLILDGGEAVGALLCWEAPAFVYVEHFYIYPDRRGERYGTRALALLCRKRPVILEIDPPTDAVSVRRRGFYVRCGFAENSFSHVHPPYHKENRGHELVVMSWPCALDRAAYDGFSDYLSRRVMAGLPD